MLIVIHYLVVIALNVYYYLNPTTGDVNIILNLVLSESIVLLPVLAVTMITKKETSLKELLGFHKIKISTVLMIVVFSFLIMPLATLLNAISMLFVDNEVADLSGSILHVPFLLVFFTMAIFGPLCEEIVFRGIIFHSYRRSRNLVYAVLASAVLFGLMHMNFNQAPYAIALGIMMALLVEATGSTTSSFIVHMIFNGETVVVLFLEEKLFPGALQQVLNEAYTKEELLTTISVALISATICTTLALCLLNRIAENENRHHFLQIVWETRHNHKEQIITPTIIIAVVLCLVYMIAEAVLFV